MLLNLFKFAQLDGFESSGRVYSLDGLAPTINTMGGGNREPKIAYTITTKAGSRPTDNFIIEPIIGALRGRNDENDTYKQSLEVNRDGVSNTLTTVQKDNVVIVPQNTKQGYAVGSRRRWCLH